MRVRGRPVTGSITPEVSALTGEIRYRVRVPVDGRRKSIGTYATEAAAVEARDAAMAKDTGGGTWTVRSWGAVWIMRRRLRAKARRGERGERNAKKDEQRWASLVLGAPFADTELRRLQRQEVYQWVEALLDRLERQTVCNALNLLRCALQDATNAGHCARNVALDIRVARKASDEDPHTFLTLEELRALLTCDPTVGLPPNLLRRRRADWLVMTRTILIVSAYTAARPSELWRLRWRDVALDGPRPELRLPKTKNGKHRSVPLVGPPLAALRAWRSGIGDALVFPGEDGKPHGEGYDAAWSTWRKASGINPAARFYDLRHTCASHLLMGSGDGYPTEPWSIERVSAFLGHSDIQVTQRHYARFAPGWLDEPARRAREGWNG